MYVLITNDDGINSPALLALNQAIGQVADTVVFAPDHNWSASGHPKTMHKPLRVDPVTLPDGSQGYSSTGAPPDCVALAWLGIIKQEIDLVVSGINMGANLGYDIFYSGTVAAAVQGVVNGIPAIAFSVDSYEAVDFDQMAQFAARMVHQVELHGMPSDMFLNVNFPVAPWEEIQGVNITRLGRRVYRDAAGVPHRSPRPALLLDRGRAAGRRARQRHRHRGPVQQLHLHHPGAPGYDRLSLPRRPASLGF